VPDGPDAGIRSVEGVEFSPEDWAALRAAVKSLESQSLATSLSRALGRRMKRVIAFAPPGLGAPIASAVNIALKAALRTAIATLRGGGGASQASKPSNLSHRAVAALSGAAGGAFGLAALPIELPISTGLMLRSIAEIARAEGEDLSSPEAALACIEVFALGGQAGESWESGYLAVRAVLAQAVGSAAAYLAGRGLIEESAPALVRYLSLVATRFGATITQKIAAQSAPVLGAAGGAAVNYLFMEHFQRLAKGHFIVRRLERRYGAEPIQAAYRQILMQQAGDRARAVSDPTPAHSPEG
jgi:hypothetical protein